LCALLIRHGMARQLLVYVGKASLFVLVLHWPIQQKCFTWLSVILEFHAATLGALAASVAFSLLLYEVARRRAQWAVWLMPAAALR